MQLDRRFALRNGIFARIRAADIAHTYGMSAKRRNFYFLLGLVLTVLATFLLAKAFSDPTDLMRARDNGAGREGAGREVRSLVEARYELGFDFPRRSMGRAALFIPEYDFIEREQAALYLYFFDIGEVQSDVSGCASTCEDDDFYRFVGEYGELWVNRFYNRIVLRFCRLNPANTGTNQDDQTLTEVKARRIAVDFMESSPLPFSYDEAEVYDHDDGFCVIFYREVGGLILRDHPTTVCLDVYGNVLAMDYYYLAYEQIATVALLTMRDAFYALPPFEGELSRDRVKLVSADLVYRFLDSILQPVFVFEGHGMVSGEAFRYYVNAARFE